MKKQNITNLLIKDRGNYHNISIDEIAWIQSEGNYITLHTDSKKYVVKQSLKRILELLEDDRFVKIQKSYVVRTDLIDIIDSQNDTVHIGTLKLPIGRSFKEELFSKYRILK